MNKVKVVLVDDHKLFREGIKKILKMEIDIDVVGEASDGEEAVKVVLDLNPDLLLFDVNMPGLDGIELVKELNRRNVSCHYLAITAFEDEEHIVKLSEVGIDGYVLKSSGLSELLEAIGAIKRGESYVDPRIASKLLSSFSSRKKKMDILEGLTLREKEILYWLSQGLSNLEIAGKLILSDKTVKNHLSHIMRKLRVNDRTQAAVLAWKMGLPREDPAKFSCH